MHDPRRAHPDHQRPAAAPHRAPPDGSGGRSTDPAERLLEILADEFTLLEARIAALEGRLAALEARGGP